MASIHFFPRNTKVEQPSDIEKAVNACQDKFDQILSEVLESSNQAVHQVEISIFKQLLEMGLLVLTVFFVNQNCYVPPNRDRFLRFDSQQNETSFSVSNPTKTRSVFRCLIPGKRDRFWVF